VRSDRRLGVRLIAEEFNLNREMRKFSAKMMPQILTDGQKQRQLHISSDFYTMKRCLVGSLWVMKHGVFNMTWKWNARAWSGEHRIYLGRKKARMSFSQFKTMLLCFFDHKGTSLPLCMMRYECVSSWLRNLLQKWTIHLIHLAYSPAIFGSFQN
jgi:hypothetical protein